VITALFALLAIGAAVAALRLHQRLSDALRRLAATEVERDTALVERNTAIAGAKWVPLTTAEIAALAKTGHKPCGSSGILRNATTKAATLCECVVEKIHGDLKYGFSGDTGGIPCRMATTVEVEALTKPSALKVARLSLVPPAAPPREPEPKTGADGLFAGIR
jgi:hypothetical protein